MVGTIPARAPLGASTTNRKWWIDVEDPAAPGVPVGIFGIGEIKVKQAEATQQDDSDMDGEGYKSSTVTALAGGVEGKLHRKTTTASATAYDPGQEIMRKAALKTGTGNRLKFRVYEMEPSGPRVEAYSFYGLVTWSPDGGGMDALDTVSFAVVTQGKVTPITHPEGAAVVNVLASVLPAGAAVGTSVVLKGTGFTGIAGAAGVKIGATNATSYTVVDDNTITAVVPAGAAGLTTATAGTSTIAYTRGA